MKVELIFRIIAGVFAFTVLIISLRELYILCRKYFFKN